MPTKEELIRCVRMTLNAAMRDELSADLSSNMTGVLDYISANYLLSICFKMTARKFVLHWSELMRTGSMQVHYYLTRCVAEDVVPSPQLMNPNWLLNFL